MLGWVLASAVMGSSAAGTTAERVLVTVEHARLNPAEQLLAQSVQGLANRRGARVWLETGGVQGLILEDLKREGWRVERAAGVWDLVDRFRPEVRGMVVARLGDSSVNAATSIAGVLDAVAVDESLLAGASARSLRQLADARGLSDADVLRTYGERFARGRAVEQAIDKPGHLRDFAIRHRLFTFDTEDREFRRGAVAGLGPQALVFGWGRDEFRWVEDLSRAGATGVAADWNLNLSALESLPVPIPRRPSAPRAKLASGKRYVAFVLSDGDNLQWVTGGFATDSKYYGSPLRGRFPMTWEVTPLLARFAPRVLRRIYEGATANDDFVTGPGLPGYTFPELLPERDPAARASAPLLRASGLRTASFLNSNDGDMRALAPWMNLREVEAGIYKEYAPYHRQKGRIEWFGDKPLASYRFVLWEGLTSVEQLAEELAAMPKEGQGRIALVNVHAWSFGEMGGPLHAVERVIGKLPPDVRVVTANQALDLMRQERARTGGRKGS